MLKKLLLAILAFIQLGYAQKVTTTSLYFNDILPDWGISDFGQLEVTKQFTDKHNGITHIYGVQSYQGMAIHPAFFDVHLHNKAVISKHHNFVKLGDKSLLISKGELSAQGAVDLAFQFAQIATKNGFGTSINIVSKDQNNFEIND